MPGISKGRLLKLKVPIPPMALQTVFAERVHHLDSVAWNLDAAATKAGSIAAGISADVFGSGQSGSHSRSLADNAVPDLPDRQPAVMSSEEVRA